MEKDDKRIEDFVNKLMKADVLEQPSFDFTDKVMSKVEMLNNSKVTLYKPLISKYVWWLLASGFVTFVGYVLFMQPSESSSLSERYNLPQISFDFLGNVSFNFSTLSKILCKRLKWV